MEDILQPHFIEPTDIKTISAALFRAGLVNVGRLLETMLAKIKEQEKQIEELEEDVCAAEGDAEYAKEEAAEAAKEFATWFLEEFEDECTKTKRIGDTEFIIIAGHDYAALKGEFHKRLA